MDKEKAKKPSVLVKDELEVFLRQPMNRRRIYLLVANVLGFGISPFLPVVGLPFLAISWGVYAVLTTRPLYQRDKMVYDAAGLVHSEKAEDRQHALYLMSKSLQFEILDEHDLHTMSLLSDNGHYRDLLPRVIRASKHHPELGILKLIIAQCYFHAADFKKTIEACAAIPVKDSCFVKGLIVLGLSYGRLQKPELGIAAMQKGLALKKAEGEDLPEVQYTLGKLHEENGDLQDAHRLYALVKKHDPKYKNVRARIHRIEAKLKGDTAPEAQSESTPGSKAST